MSLSGTKESLAKDINDAFTAQLKASTAEGADKESVKPDELIDELSQALATAIVEFLKKQSIQSGQDVSTTGSAAAQTGKTISPGSFTP